MPYRGRLIRPFFATIALLDVNRTRANTIGGEVAAGYDDVFREPKTATTVAGDRVEARTERSIRIACQVEPTTWEAMRMTPAGDNPGSLWNLVFHFCALEKHGLAESNGIALIHPRDRLVKLENCHGKTVHTFRNPPGAFCIQARPGGFGLGFGRNLLIATFEEREQIPPVQV